MIEKSVFISDSDCPVTNNLVKKRFKKLGCVLNDENPKVFFLSKKAETCLLFRIL